MLFAIWHCTCREASSFEAAERAFQASFALDDHNLEASSNLGNVMMSKCQPHDALPVFNKRSCCQLQSQD